MEKKNNEKKSDLSVYADSVSLQIPKANKRVCL